MSSRRTACTARSLAESVARPVDRVIGGYLLLSAVALAFPHRPTGWPLLLLLHLGLAALLLTGAPDRFRTEGAAGTAGPDPDPDPERGGEPGRPPGGGPHPVVAGLVDWYPLILIPGIYYEIQFLNRAVWDHYFDAAIMGWEDAVFGGQPSVTLAGRWDSLLVSEALHLAYLSYFFIVYLFPVALYLTGRRTAFHRTLFALALAFTTHYLVFVFFPVQGPRYLFPGPAGAQTDGVLYRLTRTVLEAGSSQGTAFPSSHVALTAVQTGNAVGFMPWIAPLFAVLTLGVGLGAVYGGFHYAVDAGAGLLTGCLLAVLVPKAWELLR